MIKTFYYSLINRTVSLFLTAIFVTAFPAGSSAMAFCLDEEENHFTGPNRSLTACHYPVEMDITSSDEHISALADKENNDCTDISLKNSNILNRPSKIILPVSSTVHLSLAVPRITLKLQQRAAGKKAAAFSQLSIGLPLVDTLRTVVLLI